VFSGTHTGPLALGPGDPIPPTGNKFAAHGAYFSRVRDGRIVEIHMHPDIAGYLMQLRVLPGPGA
jgi:ketosteroid isomerase-like protein